MSLVSNVLRIQYNTKYQYSSEHSSVRRGGRPLIYRRPNLARLKVPSRLVYILWRFSSGRLGGGSYKELGVPY